MGEIMEMYRWTCPECGGWFYRAEDIRDSKVMQHCPRCGADAFLKTEPADAPPEKAAPFQIDEVRCYDLYRQKLRRSVFAPRSVRSRFIPEPVGVYLPAEEAGQETRKDKQETATKRGRQITINKERKKAKKNFEKNGRKDIARVGVAGMEEVVGVGKGVIGNEKKASESGKGVTGITKNIPGKGKDPYKEIRDDAEYLPVWFITGRYGKRVYQTRIDGRTGQVRARLPLSGAKYLLLCVILTAILTLLFTLIPTPAPSIVLTIYSAEAIAALFLSLRESQRMAHHPAHRLSHEKPQKEDAVGRFLLGAGKTCFETIIVLLVLWGVGSTLRPVLGYYYYYVVMVSVICLIVFIFKRKLKPLLFLLVMGVAYIFHAALEDGYVTFAGLVILLFTLLELRSFYRGMNLANQFPKGQKRYARDAVPAAAAAILSSIVLVFARTSSLPADTPVHMLTLAGILATLILMMAHYNLSVTDAVPEKSGSTPAGGVGVDMDAQIGDAFAAHFREDDRWTRAREYLHDHLPALRIQKKTLITAIVAIAAVTAAAFLVSAVITGGLSDPHTVSESLSRNDRLTAAASSVLMWIARLTGAVILSMLILYAGLMYTVKRR